MICPVAAQGQALSESVGKSRTRKLALLVGIAIFWVDLPPGYVAYCARPALSTKTSCSAMPFTKSTLAQLIMLSTTIRNSATPSGRDAWQVFKMFMLYMRTFFRDVV